MRYIIGIDDTDNLDSRGTGFQARSLGFMLMKLGLFNLISVTRHQLLADRRIPFTSHNSSASLVGDSTADPEFLIENCREFLIRESAFDSDAGLCITTPEKVTTEIVEFGNRAKKEILSLEEAIKLAGENNIFLDGYLNTKLGMIGSLAAVGLQKGGNDGRLLWTTNLRETTGNFTAEEYLVTTGVEKIIDMDGNSIDAHALLCITDWCRPVMRNGNITLIVEKINNQKYDYRSASKEYIKSISE